MGRYHFTQHVKDQFKDRFPAKLVNGDVVMSLVYELNNAKPDNAIKNNTALMTKLHADHGYDSINFLTTHDVVFVCRGDTLVTVYPNDGKLKKETVRFRGKRKPKIIKPWMK